MRKGYLPAAAVIILALITLAVAVVIYFNRELILKSKENQPAPPSANQQSPQVSPKLSPTPDETANWKTYNGKYFSFKYPPNWTDNTGPAKTYPVNLEVIGLRISQNAVFEASYENFSYEDGIKDLTGRKSNNLSIANRETTRFELAGEGEPLPTNYSIISFVVRGTNNTSYSIVFNGKRSEITDELISQILSTFQLLE